MPESIRVLVDGEGTEPALVLERPLSFLGGLDATTGRIIDRLHPQADASVSGTVLVVEAGRGSSYGVVCARRGGSVEDRIGRHRDGGTRRHHRPGRPGKSTAITTSHQSEVPPSSSRSSMVFGQSPLSNRERERSASSLPFV